MSHRHHRPARDHPGERDDPGRGGPHRHSDRGSQVHTAVPCRPAHRRRVEPLEQTARPTHRPGASGPRTDRRGPTPTSNPNPNPNRNPSPGRRRLRQPHEQQRGEQCHQQHHHPPVRRMRRVRRRPRARSGDDRQQQRKERSTHAEQASDRRRQWPAPPPVLWTTRSWGHRRSPARVIPPGGPHPAPGSERRACGRYSAVEPRPSHPERSESLLARGFPYTSHATRSAGSTSHAPPPTAEVTPQGCRGPFGASAARSAEPGAVQSPHRLRWLGTSGRQAWRSPDRHGTTENTWHPGSVRTRRAGQNTEEHGHGRRHDAGAA